MTLRRRLLILSLLTLTLLAVLIAHGRAPAAAAPTESLTPTFGEFNFVDPIHRRLYMVGDTRVSIWSTTSGQPLGGIPFDPMIGFRAAAFDTGHNYLYAIVGGDTTSYRRFDIGVYSAITLAETNRFSYTCRPDDERCMIGLVVGPAGRVYVVPKLAYRIEVIDSATGQRLHTLEDEGIIADDDFSMAAYGDRLYVTNYLNAVDNTRGLAVFDISDVVPVRVAFHPGLAGQITLSPDGQFLTLYGQTVQQYRTQPFEPLWEQVPSPATYVTGLFPNGNVLISDRSDSRRMVVTALDALTGAPVRSLVHVNKPGREGLQGALPLPDGELAALYGTYVDLMRPIDHAAAVPIAMFNACPGGPILDRFLDPSSGWPIISDGPITTRYFDDSYRITLRDAGLWTAVTRGDYWYQADLAIALGHTLGDPLEPAGVTGIVYGLNDDWSDFYTVEISLYNHHYYHYHFHDGVWELLHEGSGIGGVTDPVLVGLDRIKATGEVVLQVSTNHLYTIEEVPGRVGILAGSFVPNVEARYTHYEFHGQNCTENGSRTTPLEVVPAEIARRHPQP